MTSTSGTFFHVAPIATIKPARRASTEKFCTVVKVSLVINAPSNAAGIKTRHRCKTGDSCRSPSTTTPNTFDPYAPNANKITNHQLMSVLLLIDLVRFQIRFQMLRSRSVIQQAKKARAPLRQLLQIMQLVVHCEYADVARSSP